MAAGRWLVRLVERRGNAGAAQGDEQGDNNDGGKVAAASSSTTASLRCRLDKGCPYAAAGFPVHLRTGPRHCHRLLCPCSTPSLPSLLDLAPPPQVQAIATWI
ncbi:hypothetical protein E2562_025722 [Oryza meyeriana var. granulata]|uniref:Uncharacterized protein n=1 Tax=Oryza meyeriana var. granulata TaxID=110450 RepID=A0A6G1CRA0_9ORYZ|nr:hypothetical protein E2562_025722 [Oryza meyeriana var. granulata]